MNRVALAVCIAAAVAAVIAVAVSSRPSGSHAPLAFHVCPAGAAVRAFRSEGIALRVTDTFVYGLSHTDLSGRLKGGPELDVQVSCPSKQQTGLLVAVNAATSSRARPEKYGFASYDRVSVSWTTRGSCSGDIRQVRAALLHLPRLPHGSPFSASCKTVSVP